MSPCGAVADADAVLPMAGVAGAGAAAYARGGQSRLRLRVVAGRRAAGAAWLAGD